MYGWGSDSSGSWGGGYTYGSARAANSRRTYSPAATRIGDPLKVANYPLGKISSDSTSPLVVSVDVTGSMSDWRQVVFEKLPLLYGEVQRYLPDVEISFSAVGDVFVDTYPIQVANFGKGKTLDDKLAFSNCGGGGNGGESYDVMASFYLHNCDIPNAKKPIFVFTGDDDIFKRTPENYLRQYLEVGDEALSGVEAVKQLAKKFDTYLLTRDGYTTNNWEEALGKEKILSLNDPRRIVDSLIGIVAGATGNFDDFTQRLGTRQTKAQVQSVMKTLHSVALDLSIPEMMRTGAAKSKKLI